VFRVAGLGGGRVRHRSRLVSLLGSVLAPVVLMLVMVDIMAIVLLSREVLVVPMVAVDTHGRSPSISWFAHLGPSEAPPAPPIIYPYRV
jgi:hypothetical protein